MNTVHRGYNKDDDYDDDDDNYNNNNKYYKYKWFCMGVKPGR